jgi:hypothetical protein
MVTLKLSKLIALLLVFWAAEVLASLLEWRGTPNDAIRNPGIGFWHFELTRLQYWAVCFLCASLIWITMLWCLDNNIANVSSILKGTLLMFGIGLAVCAEAVTSMWYQRHLPWGPSFMTGASYLPQYFEVHLIAWIFFVSVGLTGWFLFIRRSKMIGRDATRHS